MPTRLRRVLATVVVAAFVLITGCAHPQKAPPAQRLKWEPDRVSIRGHRAVWRVKDADGNPHVLFDIAGTRYAFVVDTGAGVSVLAEAHPAVTGAVGPYSKRMVGQDAAGTTRPVERWCAVERLSMGGLTMSRFAAVVGDLSGLEPHFGGRPLGGILGRRLFASCLLTFDLRRGRIIMTRQSLPPPDDADVLPFRSARDGLPLMPVRIGDTTYWAILDSGFNGRIQVSPAIAARHGLTAAAVPASPAATLYGVHRDDAARLAEDLHIGRHVVRRPVVRIARGVGGDRVIIGTDLLREFVVSLDQRNGAVRFARDGDAPIDAPPLVTLGFSWFVTADPPRVLDVVPGTAAERAGVRVGDEVVSINGTPARGSGAARAMRRLRAQQAPVEVLLRRDGVPITLTIAHTVLVP